MRFKTRGQTIVEMLVATSAVVIALMGVLGLINRSLALNRVNADSYTGTYLAAEGVELVKNFFDRDFLLVEGSSPPPDFYGWGGWGRSGLNPGVYEVDYSATSLQQLVGCSPPSAGPTQFNIEDLIFNSCSQTRFLNIANDGYYSYDSAGSATKFKRLIIIDDPHSTGGNDLEYRITSAVGWLSRGGKFVVQLQDHFLPWRIP